MVGAFIEIVTYPWDDCIFYVFNPLMTVEIRMGLAHARLITKALLSVVLVEVFYYLIQKNLMYHV